MSEKSTILKNSSALAAVSFFSKSLGYTRDALFAWIFGAVPATDAYYAAMRFITFFRKNASESNINASISPFLHESKSNISEFRSQLSCAAAVAGLIGSVAVFIFSRDIAFIMAPGFDSARIRTTAIILSIMSIQIFFISITSVWQSFLNHEGSFAKPALIQTLFSISVILSVIMTSRANTEKACFIAATAGTVSGLIQFALFKKALREKEIRISIKIPQKNTFKALISSFFSILPLNYDYFFITVNLLFSAFFPQGTLTAFYNAARLAQFPLSLASSPAATAAAGEIAKNDFDKNYIQREKNFIEALRISIFWSLPAAFGLYSMSMPISSFLYHRGAYSNEANILTAKALALFSVSIPFYSFNKILISFFYSVKKEKLAIKFFFISLFALFIISILLPQKETSSLISAVIVSIVGSIWGFFKLKKNFSINLLKMSVFLIKCILASLLAVFTATQLLGLGLSIIFCILGAVLIYFSAMSFLKEGLK